MSTTAVSYPRRFASLVKIEHTVFALPFAYVGALLCVNRIPSAHDLVWITLAMIGARSLAMGLNRLIDAAIDARNPRTAGRELPSGLLSRAQVVVFCLASLALFLVAVFQLDPIVRWLWPIPVAAFVIYPYLKRWTWLSHLWLGAVDGLAPIGAWVAITGHLPWPAWALGGAVALWVAGFGRLRAPSRLPLLGRRRRRGGTARLRARARPARRSAPAQRRVLHDERHHQRRLLRLRARGSSRMRRRLRCRPGGRGGFAAVAVQTRLMGSCAWSAEDGAL